MSKKLFPCFLLAFATLYLYGADFWEKKPYTEWSAKQCQKLLEDSPWAVRYTDSDFGVNVNRFGTDGDLGTAREGTLMGQDAQEADILRGGERQIVNVFHFRFVTAQPIRMAIARMRLLQSPNDQKVRDEVESYVNAAPPEQILVELNVFGEPAGHFSMREIENFYKVVQLPSLKAQTYLASDGREAVAELIGYMPPGAQSASALFVFPRFREDGKPIFAGDEKRIMLHTEVDLSLVGGDRKYTIQIPIKTKNMMFQGKLAI